MSERDIVESWLNFEGQLTIIKTAFENQYFQEAYKEAERLVKYLRIFAVREMAKKERGNHEDKPTGNRECKKDQSSTD